MPACDEGQAGLRFSVIIPTYQRRDLVVVAISSLKRQQFRGRFEVVVVVDGSKDGSAEALRRHAVPFTLRVVEQRNHGAAFARNIGAALACGEILLFLDDDMEADCQLLAEHDLSHSSGAEVVLGHMPLHPRSPDNLLTAGVREWSEERLARLAAPHAEITLHDLLTGQMSVRRSILEDMVGFDSGFTRGGTFGNEDIDFGYRLLEAGYRVEFNPRAISWQRYTTGPVQHLRQRRELGHADVAFARRHPDQAGALFALNGVHYRTSRWLWRPLACCGGWGALLLSPWRRLAIALVERGVKNRLTARLYYEVGAAEYWRGVYEAGGIPGSRGVRVLAYHSVSDLAEASALAPYGVPEPAFRRQLDLLRRLGFHFVSAEEVLRFLDGRSGLPHRAVLLTFDDCYDDLLRVVLPLLEEHGIPAVAFAVSGQVGGTNQWDEALGAPQLRLLDSQELREIARRGIDVGAHSRSHRPLPALSENDLRHEIAGSVSDLEAMGLPRPRLFAYPYGACDERVATATQRAGLRAAFTVDAGRVDRRRARHRLPRIEILRKDAGLRFLLKVLVAGRFR